MLPFTKAHAYGNDFLYVREEHVVDLRVDRLAALARELCDRHTGIGADGLMLYTPTADGASMRLLNDLALQAAQPSHSCRRLCRQCRIQQSQPGFH